MDEMNLKSGGRSSRNPTAPQARRRGSQREREAIEPPQDLLQPFQENVPERLQRASRRGFWLGYVTGVISAGLGAGIALLIRAIGS